MRPLTADAVVAFEKKTLNIKLNVVVVMLNGIMVDFDKRPLIHKTYKNQPENEQENPNAKPIAMSKYRYI